MESKKVTAPFGPHELTLETGLLAKQATTSILATYGDTVVLATLTCGRPFPPPTSPSNFRDFMPMTVEYREKPFAAGKIPGGFFKREGRPSTDETLNCRLIDRPLRTLFPEGFRNDIQIFASVLSADEKINPDIAGMNAAAACAAIADFPFEGPVASMRVGLVDGQFITNPTREQEEVSDMDMVISANPEGICMVEADMNEVPEDKLAEAFEYAERELKPIIEMQKQLAEAVGRKEGEYKLVGFEPEVLTKIEETYSKEIEEAFFIKDKKERNSKRDEIKEKMLLNLSFNEKGEQREDGVPFDQVLRAKDKAEEKIFRRNALEGRRVDGRALNEVRPIWIKTSVLPRVHGSVIFTRGETQALVTLTLGTKQDEQIVDSLVEYTKRFNLHYNFPPFSVGEVKPIRSAGRREIGHGALAERAIKRVLPDEEAFPYTIRLVSDILESNGSSSMASVCGGSLALMDGGAKIKAPVAGIAMGLIYEDDGKFAVLSDILGTEDAYGDMDFKVAGTEKGVTALQMDLKTPGITVEIVRKALAQAREGRIHILGKMAEALPEARPQLSEHAPKITRVKVDPQKIGLVIGSGGRTIREIQRRTGTEVEFDDEAGYAIIIGRTEGAIQECGAMITSIVEGLKVGEIKHTKVVELRDFGAFVEVIPTGEQGMVHVSELTDQYVEQVHDFLRVGDEVDVKVISVDDTGKVRMSLKAAAEALGKPMREPVHQGTAPPPGLSRGAGRGGPRGGGGRGGPRGGPPRRGRDGDRGPRGGGGGGGGGPRREGGGGGGGGGRRF